MTTLLGGSAGSSSQILLGAKRYGVSGTVAVERISAADPGRECWDGVMS